MKVYRFDGYYIWKLYDEDNGLTAWVGQDVFAACSGLPSLDMVNFQEIVKDEDDDFVRIVQQIKGKDVSVSVWDTDVSNCQDVADNEAVFVGAGSLVYTDNDVLPDGQNMNTWGMRLHGDGISINFHTMFDPDDPANTWKSRTRIHVK